MKKASIMLALLVYSVVQFSGCKNDEEKPNASKKYLKRLSYTWNLQEARAGGADVTQAFAGLSLTVNSDRTFTVANPVPPIWPADGTFTLREVSSDDFDIVRGDDVALDVTDLTETNLKIELQYQAPTGRVSSVSGRYTFVFARAN